MGVYNCLCAISVELESLSLHCLIFSIDDYSFPSWNWCLESISSPPIDNSVIVRLFNMRYRGQLSSSLPVILSQVSFSDGRERHVVTVVQLHDWRMSVELGSLFASVEHIVVQSIVRWYRHL